MNSKLLKVQFCGQKTFKVTFQISFESECLLLAIKVLYRNGKKTLICPYLLSESGDVLFQNPVLVFGLL